VTREGREGRDTERFATRLFDQWSRLRDERQAQLAPPAPVTIVEERQSVVPYGVDLVAQWSWRFIVIVIAAVLIFRALGFLEVVVIPVVVALLISALVAPVVGLLRRAGLPRGPASLLCLIGVLAIVGAMLFYAGHQVATGASDLADQASQGLGQIRDWLKTGPLNLSDKQIDTWTTKAQNGLTNWSKKVTANPLGKISEVGGVALDVVAGLFIVLFSTFFFLSEGDKIWGWIVRLTPRRARSRVDSSGRVAWTSLTQFVRATVIVAIVDAVGVMVVAAILGVPFVFAIGVLVFLGAFVPMVGATVAGTVAVLVALVDHGFLTAVIMLAGVIGVQQLEAHGLQPFLLGRWVRVHPLAVILSIATGILVAGIPGALVAVPLAAAVNAVGRHLAAEAKADSETEAAESDEEGLESPAEEVVDGDVGD
jgi:putative heme transporter